MILANLIISAVSLFILLTFTHVTLRIVAKAKALVAQQAMQQQMMTAQQQQEQS